MPELAGLGSVVLPEDLGLRRDPVVPPAWRGEGYDARYDFRTLVYDALRMDGAVWLFCPKLLNLRARLAAAELRLDDRPARIRRIRSFELYDVVELETAGAPARLGVRIGDWRAEAPVHAPEPAAFAGLDCLMTISRDNPLRWIRDWALFHVAEHGAQAVLLVDNGSTEYPLEAVAETLAAVPGIAAVRVVSADLPYGPVGIVRRRHQAKFFRAAVANLMRHRFLAAARGVLVNDVDELVVGPAGASVFDAAARSRAGYVLMRGDWRFPRNAPGTMPLHRDHVLVRPDQQPCPKKYCVAPGGTMGGRSWGAHGLDRVLLPQRFVSDEFRFLHCQGISDFWKGTASRPAAGAGTVDPATEAVMRRAFPDG